MCCHALACVFSRMLLLAAAAVSLIASPALAGGQTGACCAANSTCLQTEQGACNGTWLGGGTSCTALPCTGACCDLRAGTCQATVQNQCSPGDHIFQGGPCQPATCPVGACCQSTPIPSCLPTGPLGCTIFGGTYQGDGTTCNPSPCPGACCSNTDSTCTFVPQSACTGTFVPGVCQSLPCVGACCDLRAGTCALVAENQCQFTGDRLFHGGPCQPTTCPMGACCVLFPSPTCFPIGPFGCATLGGAYQGDGTTCNPSPCPGACCSNTDSTCTFIPQSACTGTFMAGVCQSFPCIGACCNLRDGTCDLVAQNQCQFTSDRLFHGGPCQPATCPMGACCTSFPASTCFPTGPFGCGTLGGMYQGDGTVCNPNPCPGACCSNTDSTCTFIPQSACTGTFVPGVCQSLPCVGACCDLRAGTCALVAENQCQFITDHLFRGGPCQPTTCPMGACCTSFPASTCFPTGPFGCGTLGGMYQGDGTVCNPNPCPAACCDATTGLCSIIPQNTCRGVILLQATCQPVVCPPVAKCHDLTLDATSNCITLTATPELINDGSFTTQPNCPLTFALSPSGPYPVGDTTVTLTVTDCGGRVSTCSATVHVLGADCNHDGIPDVCQCLWQTSELTGNGQISHFGGGTGDPFTARGSRVADDIYLCPGRMYRIFQFSGFMITNVPEPLRKARVQLFEDCNGAPAGEPIFTADSTDWTLNSGPDHDGFSMVKFTFDLCDAHLWLDGGDSGRTYWWSLIGLGTCDGRDLSSWATSGRRIAGLPPVKSDGVGGTYCYPTVFGDWHPLDECCIGCVNMSFTVFGSSCPIIWDNGAAVTGAAANGVRSENLSSNQRWRGADDFVAKPCGDERICLIDAWVWTSCNPVQGFLELYRNDCKKPAEVFTTLYNPTVIPTGETAVIQGVERRGYILRFEPDNLTLPGNQTWWLSAGADRTGSQNARTYFAYGTRCDHTCEHVGLPSQFAVPPLPLTWADAGPDFAFRIAAAPAPEHIMMIDTGQQPSCPADFNRSGTVTIQDLFDFLSNWFDGCP